MAENGSCMYSLAQFSAHTARKHSQNMPNAWDRWPKVSYSTVLWQLSNKERVCLVSLLVSLGHNRQKRPSPLTPFPLRSRKGTRVNTALLWQKKERGKRKQCLFIEGALLCLLLFTFISYLSKQHKCNCLSKTNEAVKSHRPRYRLAFIDLWTRDPYKPGWVYWARPVDPLISEYL